MSSLPATASPRPRNGLNRRVFVMGLGGVAAATLALRRDRTGSTTLDHSQYTAQSEQAKAAQRAALCSPSNVAGTGLRGEYFADEGCRGQRLLVRTDASIDFDGSLDWPADQAGGRPRSVRWTGWVKPPLSGHYRFHAGRSEARVLVSRRPMAGTDAAPGADIELASGRYYPIIIEWDRMSPPQASIRLEWTAPHGARFVVPRSLLYLPTGSSIATT
jgi:hypothetical protein